MRFEQLPFGARSHMRPLSFDDRALVLQRAAIIEPDWTAMIVNAGAERDTSQWLLAAVL
jgi:hypothetical protein